MTIVTVHEAKTNLSKLIAGGEVVIARGAVNTPGKRRFGALRGKVAIDARFDEPLPDDELGAWQGECASSSIRTH